MMFQKIGIILLVGFGVMIGSYSAHAEQYRYNFSSEERGELFLSEMCNTTEMYVSECDIISGRIDKNYGDKPKIDNENQSKYIIIDKDSEK